MKTKKHIFFIYSLICLGIGIYMVNAQEKQVPDLPEEVRVLPNSFKDEYTGKAYDYVETVSTVDRLGAWIRDKISSWFSVSDTNVGPIFNILKIIFYVLVILGVIYIIVRIILNKEIRWIFKRREEETNKLNFEFGENIQEVDFNTLITESVSNKDYRSAIRYYYLFLLKKLDQFDVIDYDAQKTTFDYQNEVEGSKYAMGFNKATYYYTYIWYGEFIIDEEEYKTTSNVYHQLLNQFKA